MYDVYIYGSHLTNAQIIAYYIGYLLFISRYTLRIAPPISLSTKIFPLLETHILSTPILRPSKMNIRALSYIGPKLCNSLPY